MEQEFKGKTVVVTGASRGVGKATAIALAQHGASPVIIHYNSHKAGAEDTLAAVRDAGAQGIALQADLASVPETHRFIAELAEAAPAVDILVNNAGSLVRRAKLMEFTDELYDEVMNLNVRSAWLITQALAPSMIERRSGIIVFLSSIAARNGGGPGATIYSAAKAAVATITKGVAKELAPHGIRVNGVSPGTVDNDFHARFSTRQILDAVVAQTPAGKLGTNEEVADTILFLCSDASRYIYGQTIEINGGMYMV